MKTLTLIWLGLAALLVLTACGPTSPTPTLPPQPSSTLPASTPENAATPFSGATPIPDVATVESLLVTSQSLNEVEVTIKGYLPNPCTTISQIEQQRTGDAFRITLNTVRDGAACIEVISPFEQAVTLDTTDLAPGTYTVSVQKASITFVLK